MLIVVEEWRASISERSFGGVRYTIHIWKGGKRGTYEIVSSSEFRGQLESISHINCLHNLIRPTPIYIIQLIYLRPLSYARLLRDIRHRSMQKMSYWTWMCGGVPLDFYSVTCASGIDGFGAGDEVAVYVAGYVV